MIIDKYNTRAKKINSLLCVGLDPDIEKIPKHFLKNKFPVFEFNKWIIDETHEYTACYKPNSAFYEARGYEGIKELKMTIDYINKNHPDIFTICDAKRGDIGNTNAGYVTSIFDWFGFDAMTLHPYFGSESLKPFLDRTDKVSIILCRSSNSGAGEIQDLKSDGKMIWQILAEKVTKEWNKNNNCMLMVGATYPEEMKKVREISGDMTILVPGIGAQGGDVEAVLKNGMNSQGLGLIISSSRGIIFADNPKEEARKLCEEIRKYKNI
ncbi:orotidine 5'-phosphate decarboxylase [Candidatus Nomurabacteria bacterium RIFCSPHIGHO2_01_FULL_38_19]|uniref:Orotidine-5'-phosphate decarboxylase n=1 Tax=Candidatus Nomurabacteria bacterium RIFCSPHIGHO2_01_FULL_38_19 TaxID=1801732 RepID=A0A1F6UV73_9BACT|nr:MAG: orotidine 5'-phosphate decarboxylase [Candidatus Nomurabacteria bacterium RIFCSPHIGHO2_01_FULL_38_19]